MILSGLKILELNKKYNLIEGLSEREQFDPEGSDLELRVGQVEVATGPGFLGIEERSTPGTKIIANIEIDGEKRINMKPGDYFLVKTMEKVNIPSKKIPIKKGFFGFFGFPRYFRPSILPRSTLQRCGIILVSTSSNPGYNGQLTFGLYNAGKEDFDFKLGARMFKIEFEEVIGEIGRSYSGQYQGGRTTSQGRKEKQN